jgi:hypothetical protein
LLTYTNVEFDFSPSIRHISYFFKNSDRVALASAIKEVTFNSQVTFGLAVATTLLAYLPWEIRQYVRPIYGAMLMCFSGLWAQR